MLLGPVSRRAASAGESMPNDELTLQAYLQRVMDYNESIQLKILELEISRRKYLGERGSFEPDFVASAERQSNSRQTTSTEARSLGTFFSERNNIYNGGLEGLVPTGARVRLGYTLRDLHNNLQTIPFLGTGFTNGEYQTFFGASLVQPLLKNAGLTANLAALRAAAVASDVAFQDYRRQLMMILSTAEASYWNLYLAQEQIMFFKDSVAVAETILKDAQAKLQAGKGSELEVLQAQAGLALRRSKQAEAREKFFEGMNHVTALYSQAVLSSNKLVLAVDEPKVGAGPMSFIEGWEQAFKLNPDYLAQQKKIQLENIRLAYVKNQRLPQLDLKASYGLNGLGDSPGDSWRDVERQDFPSWSVGLELRVPLLGGIKNRHELSAAKLRVQAALLSLKEIETQISAGLDTTLRKIAGARDNVKNYQLLVEFSQNLLQSELARLEVGKVESRKVLEVEADLFEARNTLADAKVQYQRANLEWELIAGSLLKTRAIDLPRRELEARTARVATRRGLSQQDYDQYLENARRIYQQNKAPGWEERARRILDEYQPPGDTEPKAAPVAPNP
jgi:outer membrane protein TolC